MLTDKDRPKKECPVIKSIFGSTVKHIGPIKKEFGFDWDAEVCEHCGKEVWFVGYPNP